MTAAAASERLVSASPGRRVLVVGWFSQRRGGSATAGDLAARDLVCAWLSEAGWPHEVALGDPFPGGVDWEHVDPARYSDVIHVCGPVAPDTEVTRVLARFSHARLIGVNVSMVAPLREWDPFDALVERDSSRTVRPDLAFATAGIPVPVVGVIRVGAQPEYRHGRHAAVDATLERFLSSMPMARVAIDTRIHGNAGGLRSAAEIESLIARMDTVVTTRLHGMVFALKHGVPALVVDPIAGGAKVSHQARVIGWPAVLGADQLSAPALQRAWAFCLSDEARQLAHACAAGAAARVQPVRRALLAALAAHPAPLGAATAAAPR